MGPDTVVLDDDLNIVQPGSGVVGRMARGGNVPLRYHKDPEKSAATFVTVNDKRYSIPGDYAIVEADGTMTLLGRGSVCINSGGEKIYPEEVESALKAHPAVFDVVVVGVPDDRWGERVAAVVELRAGLDRDARRARRDARANRSRGTRCRARCTWWTRSSARRAASPTTRGPRRSRPPAERYCFSSTMIS